MNLPEVQSEMQEDSFWRFGLCPVQDIDTVLTNIFDEKNTLSLLCCDLYMRQKFKESLKQTMLEQASIFEDQIHELHRLYQKQKKLMMEMEGNNTCISSSLSKIEDESDKSVEKVLDLEEEEEGLKNHEVHETGLSKFECNLDLNEPAKIEEHSFNRYLGPSQTKSERAESEPQDKNGINLNTSPLLSKEEVITLKKIDSEQPQEFVSASEPSRAIVQALPCLKSISLFHKRSSSWPRKRGKRGTKSTRSKAPKGSDFDVNEDDNHSLTTASHIPESNHNQELVEKTSSSSLSEMKSDRSWTNTGKRRVRKPQVESGKVSRKIARTKSKTRGSLEEQERSAGAEDIVDMPLSDSDRNSNIETSPLHWFAKIASSVVEDSKNGEVRLSVTGFHSDYQIDYFEEKTLQLTEMKTTNTSASNIVPVKHKKTRRRQGKQQLQHEENRNEASQTNVARSIDCSLMENMVIDWGTVRKRRRGIRIPAANTKTFIAFLRNQ